jgi:hypothetical protein
MLIPSIRTRRDMETAAELRAAGATWETAAGQIGRQPNLLMRWARVYSEEWERLLREAEQRLLRQGSNESRSTLRLLLRCKSSKIRLAAADKLAHHCRAEKALQEPPSPQTDKTAFLDYLEEMTDAQLQQFMAEVVQRLHPQGCGPGSENPPSPAGPG